MKKIIYLLNLIILTSCSSYYYYPTYQNIPSNTKANEIQAVYFVDIIANKGLALSYSLNKNIGVFTNYNNLSTQSNLLFSDGGTYIADIGMYYFNNLKVDNENIKITMSVSSAYSYGQEECSEYSYEQSAEYYFNLNLHRFFLQPSFSYKSRFFDFGISSRISYVNYTSNADVIGPDLSKLTRTPYYFFEPHIFFGIGYKWIKLNYHFVKAENINNARISFIEKSDYISLSINYDIDKLFKKKKQ